MKNKGIHSCIGLVLIALLSSCETEERRLININTNFLSLKPAAQYNKSFANAVGDTVKVFLTQNESGSKNLNASVPVGSFSTSEVVIGETRSYRLACNQPAITFSYGFDIIPQSKDDRSFSDRVQVSLSDSTGELNDRLELIYRNDSLLINSAAGYHDTLNLISKTFTGVLKPIISDANENRIFYFSLTKGLVGFSTREGELYELID